MLAETSCASSGLRAPASNHPHAPGPKRCTLASRLKQESWQLTHASIDLKPRPNGSPVPQMVRPSRYYFDGEPCFTGKPMARASYRLKCEPRPTPSKLTPSPQKGAHRPNSKHTPFGMSPLPRTRAPIERSRKPATGVRPRAKRLAKQKRGKQGSTTTPRRTRARQHVVRGGARDLDDGQSTDLKRSPSGVREGSSRRSLRTSMWELLSSRGVPQACSNVNRTYTGLAGE